MMTLRSSIPHILGLVLSIAAIGAAAAQTKSALPTVLVIGTGGTIAGEQQEPGTLGSYEVKKSVNEIVDFVPEVKKYANVETEQFANIRSPEITPEQWMNLARRINEVVSERPELSGIVVTHGTARLQETAFALNLMVKTDKPVVVTGAQRPSTGIGSDAPLNVLSAIRVAGAANARGKGVMVVMDDRVLAARDTQKFYGRNGGFGTEEMGMLGAVTRGGIIFFYTPARRHTSQTEFDVSKIKVLPKVDIHYSYGGATGNAPGDAKAIVVATTGFTTPERQHYEALQKKGIIVATTFPSGRQVSNGGGDSATIASQHLLPLQARILMMLALTTTQDPKQIQRIFDEY